MAKKPLILPLSEGGRLVAGGLLAALLALAPLLAFSLLLLPGLSPIRRLLGTTVLLLAGLIPLTLLRQQKTIFPLRFALKLFAAGAAVLFWTETELFASRTAVLLANPLPLYLGAVALGVALTAAAAVPWRNAHGTSLPLSLAAAFTICGFLLGRGLLLDANLLLDSPAARSANVTAAEVSHTQIGAYTHYYVILAENSLLPSGVQLPLPPEEHRAAQPGDSFLLSLHSGALGVAWAEIEPVP